MKYKPNLPTYTNNRHHGSYEKQYKEPYASKQKGHKTIMNKKFEITIWKQQISLGYRQL